jgi:hypothetical protein
MLQSKGFMDTNTTNPALAGREQKKFWVVRGGQAKEVTGYDCKPHNPDCWFVPEYGTMQEGYSLFDNKITAITHRLIEIENEMAKLRIEVRQLELQNRS